MVAENVISIEKGRHILQQLCVDTFVSNDFHSSAENTLVKIFTGPNASGKSVYLKQVSSLRKSYESSMSNGNATFCNFRLL